MYGRFFDTNNRRTGRLAVCNGRSHDQAEHKNNSAIMGHLNSPLKDMAEILSVLKQDIRLVARATSETGRLGEHIAAEYLRTNGYRLVLSNFKVPIGRNSRGAAVTGEIDIIAIDGETLCFVEVKTKTSDEFSAPL